MDLKEGDTVTLKGKSRRGKNKLREIGTGNWKVSRVANPFRNHEVFLTNSCDSILQGIWVNVYDDPDYVIVE